ncbi:MFS transporter [Oscillospiraceae bacterium CM]|nr:MFS transporter [Oscillospiraceae bacterium CM]
MTQSQQIKYSKIGVLALAHLLNDFYSNFLPQLIPFLAVLFVGFTATQASILVSAFTISSSLIQPVFGFLLDRQGKRWLVYIGTVWMGVMLSLTGLVGNFPLLVVLAALAGLGTAAFHPQATTMVNVLSGDRKAVLISAFVAFGNFGFALSPLLLVPLFQAFGLRATVFTVIPGVLVALLLLFFAPRDNVLAGAITPLKEVIASLKKASRELGAIVGVIAIRSLAYTSMLTLLPLYFKAENISNVAASHLVTIMLAAGAVGGVTGGFISDLYGRKRLIVGSLALSTPLFFGFYLFSGTIGTIFLALAGAALLSSFSVTVVAAQEAIPNNKALAAGLTMGFAGGLGGLAAIVMGTVADAWGLKTAIFIVFLLPLIAGLFGLLLKKRPSARSRRAA